MESLRQTTNRSFTMNLTHSQKTLAQSFLKETTLASSSVAIEYLKFYEWDLAKALENYFKDYEER
jgi:hypothetical protein